MTDAYGYYPGGDQPMSLQLPSGRTGVFITDPQLRGTVRAIADADKNATNPEFKTYAISPWGEVAADTGSVTRLRLAGQPYDQGSALYYMRARYYDPALGRFLSEDPIGISGGLNLYAYAGNDPVNHDDPSGTRYRWTEQGWCQQMATIQGTYDVDTGEILTWHVTGTYEDCKGGTRASADGKGGGPGGTPESSTAEDETLGRGPRDCYQRNRLSSAVTNLTGSETAGDIVQIVEVGSIISAGADLFATVLKASRGGVGGSTYPIASGFNFVAKRAIKAVAGGTSPEGIGRLVGGAKAVGDRLSPALLLTAAFSVAYNTTTDLQCRLGIAE